MFIKIKVFLAYALLYFMWYVWFPFGLMIGCTPPPWFCLDRKCCPFLHMFQFISDSCVICLEDYIGGPDQMLILSDHCGHCFHVECFKSFIYQLGCRIEFTTETGRDDYIVKTPFAVRRPGCPVCRRPVWVVRLFTRDFIKPPVALPPPLRRSQRLQQKRQLAGLSQ